MGVQFYRIEKSKRSLTIQSANLKMETVEHFREG